MSAPAGWHRQPDGRERFWDGEAWTDQFRGGAALPAVPEPQRGHSGGFYKPWMGYVGSGLLGLLLGIVMGAAGGNTPAPASAAAPLVSAPVITETVQATVTATATATPAPAPAPSTAAAAKTPAPPVETFKMPQLVGENLQLAQDRLQKLGSYVLDQEDALGLDRVQVLDSNWKVCAHTPAAGRTVAADTVVQFSSVKLTEDCP